MRELKIRNVDEEIILKLDRMAEQKRISREELLRGILKTHTSSEEIEETEERYVRLIETMMDAVTHHTEELKKLQSMIQGRINDDTEVI